MICWFPEPAAGFQNDPLVSKTSGWFPEPAADFQNHRLVSKTTGWLVDQKMMSLGRFRDEIAAAEKYDEAAREPFGEHARLNFPDGVDARLAIEAASTDGAKAKAA